MVTLREYSDAELAAIQPVEVGPRHYQNPLKPHLGDSLRANLAHRWSDLHWNQGEENTGHPGDPLDALGELLAQDSVGWYRAEGPRGSAYFPLTASDVASWEERCRAMHDSQRPVEVEEKPVLAPAEYVHMLRGD